MKKQRQLGRLVQFFRRPGEPEAEHEVNCTALCCARSGQSADILSLVGEPGEAAMLRDLGVREGVRVTVLRDGDPLVVKVDNARFGIGRSAAARVLCQLVEEVPARANHARQTKTRR
jgi:Fe2+ transport system protein FeoA